MPLTSAKNIKTTAYADINSITTNELELKVQPCLSTLWNWLQKRSLNLSADKALATIILNWNKKEN